MSVARRDAIASASSRFRSAASAFFFALSCARRSRSASTAASPCRAAWCSIPAWVGRSRSISSPTRWISASCSGESRPCVTSARSMSMVLGSSAGGIRSRRPNQTFEKRVRGPAAACLISSRVIGRKSPASMPIDFEALGFGAGARRSAASPALASRTPGAARPRAISGTSGRGPIARRDGGSAAGRGSIEAQDPPNQPVEKAHRADLSRRPGGAATTSSGDDSGDVEVERGRAGPTSKRGPRSFTEARPMARGPETHVGSVRATSRRPGPKNNGLGEAISRASSAVAERHSMLVSGRGPPHLG